MPSRKFLHRNRKSIFCFNGGIGNQLFIYAAALEYASQHPDIRVSLTYPTFNYPSNNNRQKLSHLIELRLPELQGPDSKLIHRLELHSLRISRKSVIFCKVMKRFGFYFENNADQIIDLRSLSIRRAYGYFQSNSFSEQILREISNLIDMFSSTESWYQEALTKISNPKTGAIHVRLGDYVDHKETIGILDSDYFKFAVEKSEKDFGIKDFLVFSDDIVQAKILFLSEDFQNVSFFFVEPPPGANPMHTFSLLGKTAHIVISNSTFSWWAAKSVLSGKVVFAPDKWFLGLRDPNNLIPTNWIRVPSSFLGGK